METAELPRCPPEGCQGLEPPPRSLRPLVTSFAIVAVLMALQLVGWWVTRSLVVAFDALHMFVDMGAIAIGITGVWLARRPATGTRSWGYLRVEILGALVNGALLIGMTVFLAREAWERLIERHPTPELPPKYMAIFGGLALILNIVNLVVLRGGHAHAHGPGAAGHEHEHGGHEHGAHEHGGHEHGGHEHEHAKSDQAHVDLNYQGVMLHMISDVLGSLGVVIAAAVIHVTGWDAADAVIALIMSFLILGREIMLCFRAVDVLLESTPRHVDVRAFEAALKRVASIQEVHDLHIWTLTSGVYAMSCHALVAKGADHRKVLAELNAVIRERFGIDHTTIQLEEHDVAVPAPASVAT